MELNNEQIKIDHILTILEQQQKDIEYIKQAILEIERVIEGCVLV